jgi:ribonuclease D
VVRRHGERLEALLGEPLADSDIPELPAWDRLEPAEERLLKRLGGLLRETAKRESIAAPLIATRRELEKLIRGRRDLPLLSGWRRDVAGAALLEAVEAGAP